MSAMSRLSRSRRVIAAGGAVGVVVALTSSGCAFQGVNSLPLPGAVGGPDAKIYHVEVANIATLESNSPVMIGDVVVGSVGKMTVKDWHADVEVSVKPDVVVPRQCRCDGWPNQPPGLDAPGAEPADRAAAQRSVAGRCDDPH